MKVARLLASSWISILLALWLGMQALPAESREKPPALEPLGYVSDHAGIIDQDWRARIRSVCQDLERKTGVELVVVTVPSLKPYGSANDFATDLYQKWGIGSAQEEHGVLILLSVQERQAAVTMGRRMIPVMGGSVVGKIGHEYLDPAIKNGHFGEGLYRTAVALASLSQDLRVGTLQRTHFRGLGFWITLFTASGALWFLWWLSRPDLRHPFGRIRKGEYWGSGQGGFRGNFGGLGGGMGGEGWK
ncbi:MAG TPA: TPM domain-containing protein [Nitrospiraceae bacterium]|nr:TPM domain-containing protein [Nitrospiraceae bacterium]